jgi:hypothetical protein
MNSGRPIGNWRSSTLGHPDGWSIPNGQRTVRGAKVLHITGRYYRTQTKYRSGGWFPKGRTHKRVIRHVRDYPAECGNPARTTGIVTIDGREWVAECVWSGVPTWTTVRPLEDGESRL